MFRMIDVVLDVAEWAEFVEPEPGAAEYLQRMRKLYSEDPYGDVLTERERQRQPKCCWGKTCRGGMREFADWFPTRPSPAVLNSDREAVYRAGFSYPLHMDIEEFIRHSESGAGGTRLPNPNRCLAPEWRRNLFEQIPVFKPRPVMPRINLTRARLLGTRPWPNRKPETSPTLSSQYLRLWKSGRSYVQDIIKAQRPPDDQSKENVDDQGPVNQLAKRPKDQDIPMDQLVDTLTQVTANSLWSLQEESLEKVQFHERQYVYQHIGALIQTTAETMKKLLDAPGDNSNKTNSSEGGSSDDGSGYTLGEKEDLSEPAVAPVQSTTDTNETASDGAATDSAVTDSTAPNDISTPLESENSNDLCTATGGANEDVPKSAVNPVGTIADTDDTATDTTGTDGVATPPESETSDDGSSSTLVAKNGTTAGSSSRSPSLPHGLAMVRAAAQSKRTGSRMVFPHRSSLSRDLARSNQPKSNPYDSDKFKAKEGPVFRDPAVFYYQDTQKLPELQQRSLARAHIEPPIPRSWEWECPIPGPGLRNMYVPDVAGKLKSIWQDTENRHVNKVDLTLEIPSDKLLKMWEPSRTHRIQEPISSLSEQKPLKHMVSERDTPEGEALTDEVSPQVAPCKSPRKELMGLTERLLESLDMSPGGKANLREGFHQKEGDMISEEEEPQQKCPLPELIESVEQLLEDFDLSPEEKACVRSGLEQARGATESERKSHY